MTCFTGSYRRSRLLESRGSVRLPDSVNASLPVPPLLAPRHLNRLEAPFGGSVRVVGEAFKLRDPSAEVREAHRQRVLGREPGGQRRRDSLGVVPRERGPQIVFPLSALRTAAFIINSARRMVVWFSSSM